MFVAKQTGGKGEADEGKQPAAKEERTCTTRQATQTQPALLLAADAPSAAAPLQARKIMSIRRDRAPRVNLRRRNHCCCSPLTPPLLQLWFQGSLSRLARSDCGREVSKRCGLRQHSCKALCTAWPDPIAAEIEVSQRCDLCQHSNKTLCPRWSEIHEIAVKIEVHQLPALSQHSCKLLRILFCHVSARQLECAHAAPGCHQWQLPHHDLNLFS
jgi:hypothetical protein